jgi:hypothetical protein
MTLLYIFGFIVVFFIVVAIVDKLRRNRQWKKLKAAEKEYSEIVKKYGSINGREHCPHRVVQFGQTGVPGVVTVTIKWCKVCGKNLGSATLKTSIFGSKWK